MDILKLAVVPVGKLDPEEIDGVVSRASKILRGPIEVREGIQVPRGAEDVERGQHRAATLMGLLRTEVLRTKPGKLIGSDDPSAKAPVKPDAWLFITDADLFTARTDGVFAALITAKKVAVVSVKRLREAFYRRPADPGKQRARMIKEVLRMAGRIHGLPECASPECALSASKSVPDLDQKGETYCRACAQRLFEGRISV